MLYYTHRDPASHIGYTQDNNPWWSFCHWFYLKQWKTIEQLTGQFCKVNQAYPHGLEPRWVMQGKGSGWQGGNHCNTHPVWWIITSPKVTGGREKKTFWHPFFFFNNTNPHEQCTVMIIHDKVNIPYEHTEPTCQRVLVYLGYTVYYTPDRHMGKGQLQQNINDKWVNQIQYTPLDPKSFHSPCDQRCLLFQMLANAQFPITIPPYWIHSSSM